MPRNTKYFYHGVHEYKGKLVSLLIFTTTRSAARRIAIATVRKEASETLQSLKTVAEKPDSWVWTRLEESDLEEHNLGLSDLTAAANGSPVIISWEGF